MHGDLLGSLIAAGKLPELTAVVGALVGGTGVAVGAALQAEISSAKVNRTRFKIDNLLKRISPFCERNDTTAPLVCELLEDPSIIKQGFGKPVEANGT